MKEHWEFTARPPRHTAREFEGISITIHYRIGDEPRMATGELRDFSRGGARFASSAALVEGIPIEVDLTIGSDYRQRLGGTVRWVCGAGDDVTYGCQFSEEAPWELLGELLLRGVLDLD